MLDWLQQNGWLGPKTPFAFVQQLRMGGEWADVAIFWRLQTSRQYREFSDLITMARAFSGGANPTPLDWFLAYDLVSGEGFHAFGIDALNDVIATEAGYRLGEELLSDNGTVIDSPQKLQERLDYHIKAARQAFLDHPVMKDRESVNRSFAVLMLARDEGGFFPISIDFASSREVTLWKETVGTFLNKNRDRLTTDESRKLFVKAVMQILRDSNGLAAQEALRDQNIDMSWDDWYALRDMVEVFSLINQPRTGE